MKYKYHAYFSLTDDNKTCYVNVPALELDFIIQQPNMLRYGLIRTATKETSEHVYLLELDGEIIPQDFTENINCSFETVLEIDTDKAAKNVKVIKRFDLS